MKTTTWTKPGSTLGVRDRFQSRHYHDMFLTAGSNVRSGPDFKKFDTPATSTPWHVHGWREVVDGIDGGGHNIMRTKLVELASGVAASQIKARAAAEAAARQAEHDHARRKL